MAIFSVQLRIYRFFTIKYYEERSPETRNTPISYQSAAAHNTYLIPIYFVKFLA